MLNVSYVLAERFSQDRLDLQATYFCKQHAPGA